MSREISLITVPHVGSPVAPAPSHPGDIATSRVRVDGKFFSVDGRRFPFRGVSYGTFQPRGDSERFPEREQMKLDLSEMAASGFTVVRTYTEPGGDLLELADEWGLKLFAGIHFDDWRYLVGGSKRQQRSLLRSARLDIERAARRLRGTPTVAALSLANEVPADVVRWIGTDAIASALGELADAVHDIDDETLVTYANYPSTEYLQVAGLDFVTFNLFLEEDEPFRRYVTRLQHLAGHLPLVIGELGMHVDDDGSAQAAALDRHLGTLVDRGCAGYCVFSWTDEWWVGDAAVEGWHFGLTTSERAPRPALEAVASWNERDVRDIDLKWPSISVVICAYNAVATLDECLRHTVALDYPELEIIVVDDGSTDATPSIAASYPEVRLVTIPHGGLATARNAGIQVAHHEVVAYLDSDAYPTPEWPYFLSLGFDRPGTAGCGGPNVGPPKDGSAAERVSQAPGGPVHVLLDDDRAEHIPGCNMAFWRDTLVELGGFDPIFTTAGDDVDLCWRLLDHGGEIGYHPAALVWHHRRGSIRAYLRQQRGYGRSEALVETRHPARFTRFGSARWRGAIYGGGALAARESVYRGVLGAAAFQSIYRTGRTALTVAYQIGTPIVVFTLAAAMAGMSIGDGSVADAARVVAVLSVVFLISLAFDSARRASPSRRMPLWRRLGFRLAVASLHLTQPLARLTGRSLSHRSARRGTPYDPTFLPGAPVQCRHGTMLFAFDGDRSATMRAVLSYVSRSGIKMILGSSWDSHDAHLLPSFLLGATVTSSAYPEHWLQVRVRRFIRLKLALVSVAVITFMVRERAVLLTGAVATVVLIDVIVGWWRSGPHLRRVIRSAPACHSEVS